MGNTDERKNGKRYILHLLSLPSCPAAIAVGDYVAVGEGKIIFQGEVNTNIFKTLISGCGQPGVGARASLAHTLITDS